MPVIDADTHVDETEDTWGYLASNEQLYKPLRVNDPRKQIDYWLVDGIHVNALQDEEELGNPTGARDLDNIDTRLREMDSRGIDVQVIYPTTLMRPLTERAEVELALRRSYNRWMAERCAKSNGRLRWIVLPPLQTMDKAIEELRFGKDNGACGVLKAGDEEAGFFPAESFFFPLYEEAQRLDLPVCFHAGSGTAITARRSWGAIGRQRPSTPAASFRHTFAPVINAFETLAMVGVPAKYPTLRWGFMDAYAGWVPHVMYRLSRRVNSRRERPATLNDPTSSTEIGGTRGPNPTGFVLQDDLVPASRFYVACEADEDLETIMKYTGEDNLMMGSAASHEVYAAQLQQRADRGELPQSAVRKITRDNSATFYGF
jgi:predicted TIM-barrel fold metal-dependent hydrolase